MSTNTPCKSTSLYNTPSMLTVDFRDFLEVREFVEEGLFSKFHVVVSVVLVVSVVQRKYPLPKQPPSSTPVSRFPLSGTSPF